MGPGSRIVARARALVDSSGFTAFISGVIVVNALVIGAETYESVDRDHGELLDALNLACLAIFVAELVLRVTSFGRRPHDFFRSGWNIFDFVIIGASFVPGLGSSGTALRVARLLRAVRLLRLLPDVRVLVAGLTRSIPPMSSIAVLTGLVLYLYGMVGWLLFSDSDPENWGDIGTALLTLFVLLSLESLPEQLERGMEEHPWSWIYFVSFAIFAALLLLNVLLGIVLNSLDEARAQEREQTRRELEDSGVHEIGYLLLADRVRSLRDELGGLEDEIQRFVEERAREQQEQGASP